MNVRYSNPEFWRAVRRLRESLPIPYHTTIRTVEKAHNLADWKMQTLRGKRYFTIDVRRGDLDVMLDSLTHDYAHVLEMSKLPVRAAMQKRLEHCTGWGATYAKCYRIVFETEN